MTAQVAIFTSASAVLAADSAVTISRSNGRNVYQGVEKIYPLSGSDPFAALVYGSAEIADVPWGTLLSEFRRTSGGRSYPSMEEAAGRLVAFLSDRLRQRIDDEGETLQVRRIGALFSALYEQARNDLFHAIEENSEEFSSGRKDVGEELALRLRSLAESEREAWAAADRLPGLTVARERELHRAARPLVTQIRRQVLEDLSIERSAIRAMNDAALLSLTRCAPDAAGAATEGGLVLVGFPDRAFWPEYIELAFDGVGPSGIRTWPIDAGGCEGPHAVAVRAFAQHDGVATIMNGVHPEFLPLLSDRLEAEGVSTDVISSALRGAIDTWGATQTHDILETLDVLPPPDLCEIAESLVSITALWQRMRGTLQTVGGTISVAVLTPGEPLRWAKRPVLTTT